MNDKKEKKKKKVDKMSERDLDLLKMALKLGHKAVNEMYEVIDYCEDVRNDYWKMVENLSEKVGTDLSDIF